MSSQAEHGKESPRYPGAGYPLWKRVSAGLLGITMKPSDAEMFALHDKLAPVVETWERVQTTNLADGAVLILPRDFAAGLFNYCGLPVIHADVPEPMIGLPGGPLPHRSRPSGACPPVDDPDSSQVRRLRQFGMWPRKTPSHPRAPGPYHGVAGWSSSAARRPHKP